MREFNSTGLCVPERHYMVDISGRVAQIRAMVERGDYFCINRARQYGKTTTLVALERALAVERSGHGQRFAADCDGDAAADPADIGASDGFRGRRGPGGGSKACRHLSGGGPGQLRTAGSAYGEHRDIPPMPVPVAQCGSVVEKAGAAQCHTTVPS